MNNPEPATILLIDDHPMLRSGVKQLVSMAPAITVVGEAGNGEQGIEMAEALDPDLILLDLNMPGMNGLETLDKLREKALSGRVVVFSVSNHEEDVVTALKRGADGYLLKDMEPEDLLKALQQAAAGEMVLSEALTPVLAASLRASRATSGRDVSQLTPRERDILKLIAQGLPNKMIARKLDITESTVKVHVKHLLKKMKLKSRVEAAVWVHQERIFKAPVPAVHSADRPAAASVPARKASGLSSLTSRAGPVRPRPSPTAASCCWPPACYPRRA